MARAANFTSPENIIGQFTICLYNRLSLGTGWRRVFQRCQVHGKLSGYSEARKWPKATRALGKRRSKLLYQEKGVKGKKELLTKMPYSRVNTESALSS